MNGQYHRQWSSEPAAFLHAILVWDSREYLQILLEGVVDRCIWSGSRTEKGVH